MQNWRDLFNSYYEDERMPEQLERKDELRGVETSKVISLQTKKDIDVKFYPLSEELKKRGCNLKNFEYQK